MRASSWEWFKAISNLERGKHSTKIWRTHWACSGIPDSLLILCICPHFMAKMLGATDQEIQEAVVKEDEVRHRSTVLNGNQVDFESFKSDWDAILAFVKANSGSK